jgi:alkylation response protein AidB-like acyl-CoA dehydrogenase
MDFQLTEEQEMIRSMSAKFTDEVIAPRAKEMEETGKPPNDIIHQMAELGMMGIPFPEKYGGSGGDWVSQMLCVEEISRGDPGLGTMLDVTSMIAQEVHVFGTEEQKQRWLIPLAQGKQIGAFALTEPEAGSDAGATQTTAVLEGDKWVINGTKQFISNIGYDDASIAIITALCPQFKREGGNRVINTFVVPKGTLGFTVGTHWKKIGWPSFPTNELNFQDCSIPRDYLLGEEGRGFAQHLEVLQTGRIFVAAISVGVAQACFNASLAYAKQRIQFQQPIYRFEAISFRLADMAMHIELARLMYLKAAWMKDKGLPHILESSYAKLYASEMAERAASDAVQIHGGYGCMDDYAVSRYYRGAKILQIIEGTSEIQRYVISRNL